MSTDTLPDTLAELQRLIDQVSDRLDTLAAEADRIIAAATPDDAPAYHPERMGYLAELRVGDRVLFAGGWREVGEVGGAGGDWMAVTFTDPDMDPLIDRGTHAIRIQKRADEQQAAALHRRDTGGL